MEALREAYILGVCTGVLLSLTLGICFLAYRKSKK